ncbi:unnamed protein product [Allacma fusca]|uniref:MYND-type domain-containing protein n=1 Tax=Allacma fusca TaxID=39272 RepID=A0A8J2KF60_9HEXA|nr:unnamed protein product [Allacma fusca]
MSDLSVCPVCGEKATKICTACQSVAYCSKEHQREDWSQHQKICRPYKIRESPEVGQYWAAVRDLEAGTILLEESPCIFIPQGHPSKSGDLFQTCLTCGTEMHSEGLRLCSRCSWPVCKQACEEVMTGF